MGSSTPQRSFSDFLDLLKAFNERDAQVLVVGGQAVNFWAEAFQDEEPQLLEFRPFTSTDLDLHRPDGSARSLLRAKADRIEPERDPFGKAFTIVSQTFLIQDASGRVLPIDELKMVAGLRPDEVRKGSLVVEFGGVTLRVLNPVSCLKAKFYNVRKFDQGERQDVKHVRILILCVRAFIRRLLRDGRASGNYRPALNALRQLLLCTSHASVIRTARAHGIDVTNSLPVTDVTTSEEPRILRFASHQLPKWQRLHGSPA